MLNWSYQIPDTNVTVPAQYNYCIFNNKRIGWAYSIHNGIHTTIGGDTIFLTSIPQISNEVPKDFKLYQNYPNPFNQCTIINVQLSIAGQVRLNVYDITGKLIETLINQNKSSGKHSLKFDGSNLSSGIYFYSLFVDGMRIDTKKMILLK